MDGQVAFADRPGRLDQGIVIKLGRTDLFQDIGFLRAERPVGVVADIEDQRGQGR